MHAAGIFLLVLISQPERTPILSSAAGDLPRLPHPDHPLIHRLEVAAAETRVLRLSAAGLAFATGSSVVLYTLLDDADGRAAPAWQLGLHLALGTAGVAFGLFSAASRSPEEVLAQRVASSGASAELLEQLRDVAAARQKRLFWGGLGIAATSALLVGTAAIAAEESASHGRDPGALWGVGLSMGIATLALGIAGMLLSDSLVPQP